MSSLEQQEETNVKNSLAIKADMESALGSIKFELSQQTRDLINDAYDLSDKLIKRREESKVVLADRLREAKTEAEIRHKIHLLIGDFNINRTKERYESWISMLEMQYKTETADFLQKKYIEIVNMLEFEKRKFNEMIDSEWRECEKRPDSITYEKNKESIKRSIDSFYSVQEKMLKNFEETLESRIGKQGINALPGV